jgi:hypothetical protein
VLRLTFGNFKRINVFIKFNSETPKVVRNNRLNYNVPENEKRTVDEQINISFAGADPTKTPDATYYDWDNNGTLDCQDTDSVYDKLVQKNKGNIRDENLENITWES